MENIGLVPAMTAPRAAEAGLDSAQRPTSNVSPAKLAISLFRSDIKTLQRGQYRQDRLNMTV
jgi:site-specific recombinase